VDSSSMTRQQCEKCPVLPPGGQTELLPMWWRVWSNLQRGTTCAAAAGRSRSPGGSRCRTWWVSDPVRYRGRPAEPGQSFQEGREVLEYIQNTRDGYIYIYIFIYNNIYNNSMSIYTHLLLLLLLDVDVCTFGSLPRAAAHSARAVKAVNFDWTQMQHLGILTDSIDLISDPFQSHDLALRETDRRTK